MGLYPVPAGLLKSEQMRRRKSAAGFSRLPEEVWAGFFASRDKKEANISIQKRILAETAGLILVKRLTIACKMRKLWYNLYKQTAAAEATRSEENMENLFWIGFIGALVAGLFAWAQAKRVLRYSEGTDTMKKIASSIRAGANAYLKHQYTTVAKVFVVVFVILLVIAFASNGSMLSKFTPFAFVTGGIWSMLAGFIGMKIATNSNARTAQAASESLNKGLRVAFSSGSVMGFTVVGLGMLDITVWFFLLRYAFGINDPVQLGNIMVMNGMGASFMALFARVGGGIYTKAADVGADLVGKVEAGIPEDDPRNPATIADNVGDNVGDVAGMGADLYESYVGSILATFALGAVGGYGWGGLLLPVALAVCGIFCSIIGSFLVKTREDATQQSLLKSLRTGTYTAAVLSAVLAAPLTYFILDGHMGVYVSILCGLIGGCAIGYFTEYYTSDTYKPTQELAAASETGSATIIIGGLSLGLQVHHDLHPDRGRGRAGELLLRRRLHRHRG